MYLRGLNLYGGKFIDTKSTIDTSLAANSASNKSIADSLGVPRRRRAEFDLLVETEKEKLNKKSCRAKENTNFDSDDSLSNNDDDSADGFSSFDKCQSDISHDFDPSSSDTKLSNCQKAPVIRKYRNIFNENLKYRKR